MNAAAKDLPPYVGAACPLTPRQLGLVRRMAAGASVTAAARGEGISPNTARNQLAWARANAGADSNAQLVGIAVRRGWI